MTTTAMNENDPKPPSELETKTPEGGEAANGAIECRAAIAISPTATNEILFLPVGLHPITPVSGGIGRPINVMIDASSSMEIERQRGAIMSKTGKRIYFDFNHEDGPASFWPASFSWRNGEGVIAKGEWTASGRRAVEGKDFRAFSPVFHVDNKRNDPARVVCCEAARPNMGGLVNDPAFNDLPLWAKNDPENFRGHAGATSDAETQTLGEEMTNQEQIAALQAKNKELETKIEGLTDLVEKNGEDETAQAQLDARQAEYRQNQLEIESAELKAKNEQQEAQLRKRCKADAEAAVKAAVKRGAILPRDTRTQNELIAKGTADPSFLDIINSMQGGGGALSGRITRSHNSGVEIVADSAKDIIRGYYDIVKRNTDMPLSQQTFQEKGRLARQAAAIFSKDIEPNKTLHSLTIEEAIEAADVSDVSIGVLAGTLVLQRALPLFQYEFPVFDSITTDFSDEPGLFNQTEDTRIVIKPAVQTYDASKDSAGRPKGWNTVSPAQTVDVPITLDEYVGVPIVFGVDTLAKTIRRLFDETAPQALYALGLYFANKLTALITAANFNAYAGTSATSGATTSGSNACTAASTANMYPGQEISGTGIPTGSVVTRVVDATNFTISQNATATNTGLTFTLSGGKVPTTYATYVSALADFNVAALSEVAGAFTTNEVPSSNRSVMLNAAYYNRLGAEAASNTGFAFWAAMRKPDIVTDRALPRLMGFDPIEAGFFPTSNNRVGFAYHRSALAMKARLPQDFMSAVGAAAPGSVTTVTAPGGLSVLLVQYISLRENYAEWRPEVMIGASVGNRRGAMVITSS